MNATAKEKKFKEEKIKKLNEAMEQNKFGLFDREDYSSKSRRRILQPVSGREIRSNNFNTANSEIQTRSNEDHQDSINSEFYAERNLHDSDPRRNVKREKLNIDDNKTLQIEEKEETHIFRDTMKQWGLESFTNTFLDSGFLNIEELLEETDLEFFIPDDEARQVLKLKLFDIVNSRRKNCSIIDSDLNKGDLYEEMEIIVDRNKEEFEILREISEYEEDKFYQFSQAVMNFQNIKDQVRIISGNSMILYSSKSRIPINQIIEENLEPRQERHSSPKMVDTKISTCDIQDTSTQSIQESEISTYMRQNHAVQIKQLNPKVNIPVKISSEDEIAKEHNPLNKKKFLHGNSKINYCWHCYQIFENSKYARDFCSEDCQNDHIEKTKASCSLCLKDYEKYKGEIYNGKYYCSVDCMKIPARKDEILLEEKKQLEAKSKSRKLEEVIDYDPMFDF